MLIAPLPFIVLEKGRGEDEVKFEGGAVPDTSKYKKPYRAVYPGLWFDCFAEEVGQLGRMPSEDELV